MRASFTTRFFLFAFILTGPLLFSVTGFSQEKPDEQKSVNRTITVHVTRESDGKNIVIDTTIINSDDFDADAFLIEKGIDTEMHDKNHQVKEIIVCSDIDKNSKHSLHGLNEPDTIISGNDTIIMLSKFIEAPGSPSYHHGMSTPGFHPGPEMFSQMEGPQVEAIIEGLARSCGLGDVMPFGEMKKMVVKKKRHGKKIIISFEDRDEDCCKHNACEHKKECVILYNNRGECPKPCNEERVIMKGDPEKKVIIIKNGETVTPEKQEIKVIIKDEKSKS